jgi:phosphatidylserine/phosphatidylglycerophosphate/cardiolipin synthase-like enzyme
MKEWQIMNLNRLPLLALIFLAPPAWSFDLTLKNSPVQVFFSPRGGCTEAIVATVGAARKSILVQAYTFTSAPIAGALKAAHDRGVDVRILLDKSQETEHYSSETFLLHAAIPTWIDRVHAIAHNKVMVIDGETVITGSFNFTKAAEEHNAENLMVIKDHNLAALYADNWESHRQHSQACPVAAP